jgi:hypothetical protein
MTEIINKILIVSVSSLFSFAISVIWKSSMSIEIRTIIFLSIFILVYITMDCCRVLKKHKKEQGFKQENRKDKITSWRKYIDTQFNWDTFRDTAIFSEMKYLLPEKITKEIDPYSFDKKGEHIKHFRSPIGRDNLKQQLLNEIARIEREWNLI